MTIRGIEKKIEVIEIPLLITCIVLKIFYPKTFAYMKNLPFDIQLIGILMLLAGSIIHFYSAYMMVRAFKEKKLLTTGPFAICRNPMYSTLFFIIIPSISIVSNIWLIMLAIPILLFIFFKNIEEEENYLLKEFKKDYIAYKKHVTRLLPKVL